MKKNYLLAFALLVLSPLSASAKSTVTLTEGVLTVEGECAKPNTLSLRENSTIIYSTGVNCENGEFAFKDDLSQWGLVEKSYELWLDDTLLEKDFAYSVQESPNRDLISIGSETANKPEATEEKVSVISATDQLRDGLQKVDTALQALEQKGQEKNEGNTLKKSLITFMRNAFEVLSSFFVDFEKSDVEVQIPDKEIKPENTLENSNTAEQIDVPVTSELEVAPEESTPDEPADTMAPEISN